MTAAIDPARITLDPPEAHLAWAQAVRAEVQTPAGAAVIAEWPLDPDERTAAAKVSAGPALIDWAEGRVDGVPGLIDPATGRPWRFSRTEKRWLTLMYRADLLVARYDGEVLR